MSEPKFKPGDRVTFRELANNTGAFITGIVVDWPKRKAMVSRKLSAPTNRLPNPFRKLNVPVRIPETGKAKLIVIVPVRHCTLAGPAIK